MLTLLCRKAEVFYELLLGSVGEGYVAKFNRRLSLKLAIGRVGSLCGSFDKLENSVRTRKRVLQLGDNARDLVEGLCVLSSIGEEARKSADTDTGSARADADQRARERNCRVDDAVYKAGAGVCQRREEYRLERRFAESCVDLIKACLCLLLIAERNYSLVIRDHLVDKRGLLASYLGLELEHRIGLLCDKRRNEERERCHEYNDERDHGADDKHKHQRAENCHNSAKELGKAHQETVRELIRVGYQSADDVTRAVRVDERDGE